MSIVLFLGQTDRNNERKKTTETTRSCRSYSTLYLIHIIYNGSKSIIMNKVLVYSVLLLSVQSDNLAGVLRAIRDMDHQPVTHFEPYPPAKSF